MTSSLPQPNVEAQQHSERLRQYISQQIKLHGDKLSFRDFMELVLYAPGLGYYSAGSHKLGEAGDFITAPELSPLFGATIAKAVLPVLQALPQASLLEIGAGSGSLAVSVLRYLQQQSCSIEHYYILEVSADLRERQREQLQQAGLLDRVVWLETLPENFLGVVLANEVLDAMPINLIEVTDSGVQERYVAERDGEFVWQLQSLSDKRLKQRMADIENQLGMSLPVGYVTEINLAAEDWIASLAEASQQTYILLIDYGFPRHEYYHAQRHQGTLMCHYRHHSHDDPFRFIGLQDITAHVDFTAMADAALTAGLQVAGYTTQANFLLGSGLMELLSAEHDLPEVEQIRLQQQVKKLTMPHEMGELFKVMGLQKNLDINLPGFLMRDMRDHL